MRRESETNFYNFIRLNVPKRNFEIIINCCHISHFIHPFGFDGSTIFQPVCVWFVSNSNMFATSKASVINETKFTLRYDIGPPLRLPIHTIPSISSIMLIDRKGEEANLFKEQYLTIK